MFKISWKSLCILCFKSYDTRHIAMLISDPWKWFAIQSQSWRHPDVLLPSVPMSASTEMIVTDFLQPRVSIGTKNCASVVPVTRGCYLDMSIIHCIQIKTVRVNSLVSVFGSFTNISSEGWSRKSVGNSTGYWLIFNNLPYQLSQKIRLKLYQCKLVTEWSN